MASKPRVPGKWQVTYSYSRPPRGILAGIPGTGKLEFLAKGSEEKACKFALALLCKKHLVEPEDILLATCTKLEEATPCTQEHTAETAEP